MQVNIIYYELLSRFEILNILVLHIAWRWHACGRTVPVVLPSWIRLSSGPRLDGKDHEVLATFSCPCQLYSENQLKCCNFKLIFNGTFFAVFGTKLLFPSHVKSKIAFSADNYNSSSTSFSLDVLLCAEVDLIIMRNNHDQTFQGVN